MADYKLARFKSKEYPYFHGRVKRPDGSYVRYWSNTDPIIVRRAAREKAKKAGTLPIYSETTKRVGDKLYEETQVKGNKVYYGRIGRPLKRKNPETGKMETYTKQYKTGNKETLEEAKTSLAALEKEHPITIKIGPDSPQALLKAHLESLPEGSTINRNELMKEYFPDTKWRVGRIGRVLKEFKKKKFNIIGTGPPLRKGETRIKLTQPERNAINKRFSKEYGNLKGRELYKAMAAVGESEKARQVIYAAKAGTYTGGGSGSPAKREVIRQINKLKKLPWIRRWFKEGDFTRESVRKASQKVGNAIKTQNPLPRGQTWLSIGARRLADLARALTGDTEYIKMTTMDKGVLKGATRVVDTTKESIFQDFGSPFKREMYDKNVTHQMGKPANWLTNIKSSISRKLRPEHQVDVVKNIASAAKAGTAGYSGFWQVLHKDIHNPKLTVDLGMEEAEFKLRNVGDNSKVYTNPKTGVTETREQIRDTYNKKVRSFLKTANKDVKPGDPLVRALELTLDAPPSKTIGRYGEMSDIMKQNVDKAWADHQYGFKVPKDLLFPDEMKAAVKDPSRLQKIWKMGPKVPRVLGIPLAIGAGIYALGRSTPLEAAEIEKISDQGTVVDEQVTEVAETPTTEQMTYNSITGEFDNAEGDPETQEGVLNWIADNPIKSGLAPIPIGIGVGLGADAMKAENVGKFFKSMKFILPPAYAAEKLHQYKRGDDMGQMFANPIDAVWAMALDTKDSAGRKMDYYTKAAQKAAGYSGVTKAQVEAQQLGLRHLDPRKFKETGAALKRATMAPRSFGTSLVFPFAGPKPGAGAAMKVFRGAARLAPLGPLPMALLAGSMAWDKYKFNKKVGDHVDALRAKGVVSEDDAQSMNTIYKQGWLGTTAIGAKILGSEELMLDGELADIDKQKEVLAKMKEFYGGREQKESYARAGERQEDFFDWFSQGGRVGLAEGGNKPPFGMTRRSFLKWLIGSIVTGVAAVSGKGLKQAAKTATATVSKTPAKFIGVEGMPLWFPRAVAKIKTHGKLLELADKHYTQGDMYEMMIPVKIKRSLSGRKGHTETVIEQRKVTMEDNPLTGEIDMQWTGTDNFGGDAVRHISFKPGSSGYQKFGVDDADAAARGITEYRRVKVEEPEFSYSQPDQSNPYRDDIEYLDIFEEGDEIVKGLEDLTGTKNMVAKDGSVIKVPDEKGVDEAFQKKIYKDLEGEEAVIPEPEGVGVSQSGDVYGEEQFKEIIEGNIPDHLKKKAEGGIIETGNIARRPGAVPPLSGPTPQGRGILGLFSSPKRVNIT